MGGTKQPFMVALMGGGVCKRVGGGERGEGGWPITSWYSTLALENRNRKPA